MPNVNTGIYGSKKSERMPSKYRRPRRVSEHGIHDLGEAVINYPKIDPTENVVNTFGACKNSTVRIRRNGKQTLKCKAFHVELGNGLCMDCWDKTIEYRANDPKIRLQEDYKTALPQG